MVTVISIVGLILVGSAVTIATTVGSVMSESLNATLKESARGLPLFSAGRPLTTRSAQDILATGRQANGTILIVNNASTGTTAALVKGTSVTTLTSGQVAAFTAVTSGAAQTIDVPGLGDYRVLPFQASLLSPEDVTGMLAMPLSELNGTIARILWTILLVTLAGLLLLGIAVTLVIRRSLMPLRAVADTATRVASIPLSEGSVSIAERVPASEADDRTEIGQVGAALNTLLDHVDTSLAARQRNEERMRSFVADASHELRTPLASIRGYSELSLRDPSLSENTGQALERIQAQSLRMTSLVEDLLLLARLDEGQELVYGAVDLATLAVESVADAQAAGSDHQWRVDVPEHPVIVAGDARRLAQVAANLLANARVHTPAGTVITASVSTSGHSSFLRVHDNGPGIDPAVASELFERFSRADRSRARQTGGTGLGLSIARAIARAHHGDLSVTSVPGNTVFELRLPARPQDPAPRV